MAINTPMRSWTRPSSRHRRCHWGRWSVVFRTTSSITKAQRPCPKTGFDTCLSLGWIVVELSGPSRRQRTRHNRPDRKSGPRKSSVVRASALWHHNRFDDCAVPEAGCAETATTSTVDLPDVHSGCGGRVGCLVSFIAHLTRGNVAKTFSFGCVSVFTGPPRDAASDVPVTVTPVRQMMGELVTQEPLSYLNP